MYDILNQYHQMIRLAGPAGMPDVGYFQPFQPPADPRRLAFQGGNQYGFGDAGTSPYYFGVNPGRRRFLRGRSLIGLNRQQMSLRNAKIPSQGSNRWLGTV